MPPWLVDLIRQFGRDVITAAPAAERAARNEMHVLRDPYVDKFAYFFRRGGEAERDAADHRLYDAMNDRQRKRLAELQIEGQLNGYRATKPSHLRPWTGAWEFALVRQSEYSLLGREVPMIRSARRADESARHEAPGSE